MFGKKKRLYMGKDADEIMEAMEKLYEIERGVGLSSAEQDAIETAMMILDDISGAMAVGGKIRFDVVREWR